MQRLIFTIVSFVLISGNIGTNAFAHVISESTQTKPKVTDLVKHGKELWNQKDIDGALADYQLAATIESKNAQIQASIGFLFTQQSNFPEAIAAFQRAIQLDNKDAKSLIGLGFIYAKQENFTEALGFYRRAIAIDPKNIDTLQSIGYIFDSQVDLVNAEKVYRQIISMAPKNIKAYLNLGHVFEKQNNLKAAADIYAKAVRLAPANPDVLFASVSLDRAKITTEAAIVRYQQILKINSRHLQANLAIAQTLATQGKFDEAIGFYQTANKVKPILDIQRLIAALYLKQNNLSMAIITYREIIKNNPEDALAHFNMGKILAQQTRNQEAVQSFQRAEELYTRLGDLKAINEVQAAIKELK